MTITLRHHVQTILREAGWELPAIPVTWSPRMTRCAGLFVVERDVRGVKHAEIRLSIPLLRRQDRPWPIQACGCHCHDPRDITRRVLEHELIHYKLWRDGEKDWGHTEKFRRLAWETFGHQSITHGIGVEDASR